jgi:hypothetical protein
MFGCLDQALFNRIHGLYLNCRSPEGQRPPLALS